MFKKLDKPKIDWNLYLNNFFDSRTKYKEFYKGIKIDYIEAHLIYDRNGADFNSFFPLDVSKYCSSDDDTLSKIETLKNLYLSKTSYFCRLLDDLRTNNGLQSCPNCGEDGSPNTLDHYLPKVTYPELSVCIYNLVPMCSKCQNEKSTDYKDLNNNKLFFHPYYDNYSSDMYILEIMPQPTYRTPSFSIKVRNSVPSQLKEIALSQFKELNLANRFSNFITQTYLTTIDNLLSTKTDINELLNIFINMHIKKGINNWNVILYKSLHENNSFVEWIEKERNK